MHEKKKIHQNSSKIIHQQFTKNSRKKEIHQKFIKDNSPTIHQKFTKKRKFTKKKDGKISKRQCMARLFRLWNTDSVYGCLRGYRKRIRIQRVSEASGMNVSEANGIKEALSLFSQKGGTELRKALLTNNLGKPSRKVSGSPLVSLLVSNNIFIILHMQNGFDGDSQTQSTNFCCILTLELIWGLLNTPK